jgi:dTDP-4-dehydrorhamnose reductase
MLARVCATYGCNMIQPTTDCVYSGTRGGYTESDLPDETGNYGVSKSLGEPLNCTVIRTSIIGEELANKKSFLEFVRNSTHMQGWDNHMWNGITCLQYCKVVETIITNHLFWKGVRHICSPSPISKYMLACTIASEFKVDVQIERVLSETPCDRTLGTLFELFYIPDIKEQIAELRDFNIHV